MPPSALDRQCPSFLFLLEAELMGGATFVKNRADLRFAPVADQPPLRSGGRFFIKPRARKRIIFSFGTWLGIFFLYLSFNSPLLGPVQ